MFQNLIILSALFLPLCCSINMNSNSFCKLTEKECSLRNTPFIFKCGQRTCSRNETECKKYLNASDTFKVNQMHEFIQSVTSRHHIKYNNDIRLVEKFKLFQSNIKDCTKTAYKWQPNDFCLRESNCFQVVNDRIRFRRHLSDANKQKKTKPVKNMKNFEQADCPCPKSKPHACGHQTTKYCSVSKEACDSFGLKVAFVNSKSKHLRISAIKKCGNDFDLIG